MKYFPFVLRALILLAVAGVFGYVLNQHYVFTRTVTYRYRPPAIRRTISLPEPAALVQTADPKMRWKLDSNSLVFMVHIPRLVERVRLVIQLLNENQPNIYLAAARGLGLEEQRLIVYSSFLEKLLWPNVRAGKITLWQRPDETSATSNPVRRYANLESFLTDPPDPQRVAVVGVSPYAFLTVPHYQPATNPIIFSQPLRGSHDFYFYAANENIQFQFRKFDLNRKTKSSPLTATITRVGLSPDPEPVLYSVTVGDDGVTDGRGHIGPPQFVQLKVPRVTAGLYHLHIATSEDVIFSDFTSWQHFIGSPRLFLAAGPTYGPQFPFQPIIYRQNGSALTLAPVHDTGLQTVVAAGKPLPLKEVRREVPIATTNGIVSVVMPKGDVIVSSTGLVYWPGAEVIPGRPMPALSLAGNVDLKPYDYVLAAYVPQQTNGQVVIDHTFSLSKLRLSGADGKSLTFRLDAPDLRPNDYRLGLISITATFTRSDLRWSQFVSKLRHLF